MGITSKRTGQSPLSVRIRKGSKLTSSKSPTPTSPSFPITASYGSSADRVQVKCRVCTKPGWIRITNFYKAAPPRCNACGGIVDAITQQWQKIKRMRKGTSTTNSTASPGHPEVSLSLKCYPIRTDTKRKAYVIELCLSQAQAKQWINEIAANLHQSQPKCMTKKRTRSRPPIRPSKRRTKQA